MDMKSLPILFLVIFVLISCEQSADVSNTKSFSAKGIVLTHPGNWKVTEDVFEGEFRYLFIESSGNAIVAINTYPKNKAPTLDEYVEFIVSEYSNALPFGSRDKGKINKIKKNISNTSIDGYRNNFAVEIAGIKEPHTSEIFLITSNETSAFIMTQVATEDKEKVVKGFDLVLSTIKLD